MANSSISTDQCEKALGAVLGMEKKYMSGKVSSNLFSLDETPLHMQIGLKKTPGSKNHVRIKVHLPHLKVAADQQVCLFIKDRTTHPKEDYEETVKYFKKKLQEFGVVNITEVISLKQLNREFKPFEAKIKLCKMFDVFLADERIMKFLPKVLGKSFWKFKKFPTGVKLTTSDMKLEIERNLSTTIISIPPAGGNFTAKVGSVKQPEEELLENMESIFDSLARDTPGGWENIRSIYLKTHHVTSVPVYIDGGSANDVTIKSEARKTAGSISTGDDDGMSVIPGVKVTVTKQGKIKVMKDAEDSDVDEEEVEKMLEKMSRKRKGRKDQKREKPAEETRNEIKKIKEVDVEEEFAIERKKVTSESDDRKKRKIDGDEVNKRWDEDEDDEEDSSDGDDDDEDEDDVDENIEAVSSQPKQAKGRQPRIPTDIGAKKSPRYFHKNLKKNPSNVQKQNLNGKRKLAKSGSNLSIIKGRRKK